MYAARQIANWFVGRAAEDGRVGIRDLKNASTSGALKRGRWR